MMLKRHFECKDTLLHCKWRSKLGDLILLELWVGMSRHEVGNNVSRSVHRVSHNISGMLQYRLSADFRLGKSEFCAQLRAAAEGSRWGPNYYWYNIMEVTHSGPRGAFCATAQGNTFHLWPHPDPYQNRFRNMVVRWNVNNDPERYTRPHPDPYRIACCI